MRVAFIQLFWVFFFFVSQMKLQCQKLNSAHSALAYTYVYGLECNGVFYETAHTLSALAIE